MHLAKPLFLIPFLCLFIKILNAQEINQGFDKVYGLDPHLYNGKIYNYFVEINTRGNQFLSGNEFIVGSVRIKGVTYPDVLLNYDIFNQQVLLKSQNSLYSNSIIALSQGWLEGFSLGSANFEIISFRDTSQKICQVSGNSDIRILTCWRKEHKIEYYYTTPIYVFSLPEKEMYLQIGPDIKHFSNNRSYISCFGRTAQAVLKNYMRQHKVNVKKADADKLRALTLFCNTLSR